MNALRGWSLPAALALLLWLAAGVGTPWCLDDGLRLLAASGPSLAGVHDLGAVVNTDATLGVPVFPDQLTRATFPIICPFVHWQDGRALLVFPPLYLALLWTAERLGALGPVLLALLTGLLLAWAARRFTRDEVQPTAHVPAWLMGLLASPVLFYLGVSWEVGLVSALLLLLLQERRRPLPAGVSALYGLLPWLRPEALLLWAGGLMLLHGRTRRLLSLAGLLVGALLQRALTGHWAWLQVLENSVQTAPRSWDNLAAFWLPAGSGPWAWAGLGALALLAWASRRDTREETAAWLLLVGLAAAFAVTQFRDTQQILPCWGALFSAPLAVGMLAGLSRAEIRRGIGPELALLALFLGAVSLASPVNQGFHWGPRLLVPALLPLGLWFVLRGRAGWPRRLALGLALAVQAVSLMLLAGRQHTVELQDQVLAELCAPALVTSEFFLLGDHPWLAQGRLLYLPWGEGPAMALVEGLRGRGVGEIDLVSSPGHPLARFLEQGLGLQPIDGPRLILGSRLGQPLEWRRLRL